MQKVHRTPKETDRYSNARMRKDIYRYLESQGFELTPERHVAIKEVLSQYETQKMGEMSVKLSVAMNGKK